MSGEVLLRHVRDVLSAGSLRQPVPEFIRHRDQPVRINRRNLDSLVLHPTARTDGITKQRRQLILDSPAQRLHEASSKITLS
jgi:hypothetical protein